MIKYICVSKLCHDLACAIAPLARALGRIHKGTPTCAVALLLTRSCNVIQDSIMIQNNTLVCICIYIYICVGVCVCVRLFIYLFDFYLFIH